MLDDRKTIYLVDDDATVLTMGSEAPSADYDVYPVISGARLKAIVELQNAVLNTFAELVEYRDQINGGHIGRIQEFMEVLIAEMQTHPLYHDVIESWDMPLILLSAQLHDIGKIAISDSILMKPGKLMDYEREIIKTHVTYGVHVIDKIMSETTDREFLEHARTMVFTHHEKWDGSGYPRELKGDAIPLQGRLMALVDVYDALISDRPYKEAYPHGYATEIIESEKGSHFDPDLVDIFLDVNDRFESITKRHYKEPKIILFPDQALCKK